MPVKVEQINEYLFSDTVQSKKKTKSGSDEISQGQYRGHPSKTFLIYWNAFGESHSGRMNSSMPEILNRFLINLSRPWKSLDHRVLRWTTGMP